MRTPPVLLRRRTRLPDPTERKKPACRLILTSTPHPSDITASAIKIGNLKTAVDNSIDHLANARKDAGSLEGESATGAQNLINSAVKTCEGMVKDLTNYKNALDNLASGLTSIGSSLASIRE